MKKLIVVIVGCLLCASCAGTGIMPWDPNYTCVEESQDVCAQAKANGYQTRLVSGPVWEFTPRVMRGTIHRECQVFIPGDGWCFVDKATGEPITGWFGHMFVDVPMDIKVIQ